MKHRLTKLITQPDATLHLTWDDGFSGSVRLADYGRRGGLFAPLAAPDLFANARIADGGFVVSWAVPGKADIEFSSDGLREDARLQNEHVQAAE